MRIGVIGVGNMGGRYLLALEKMGEHNLVLYDSAITRQSDRRICSELYEFWATRPDAVLICTPPDSHVDLLWQAFDHDCAVFVEKPLSDRPWTLLPNTQQIGQGNIWVNMVGCNLRFHPGPSQIKTWLDESAIGEVETAHLRCSYHLPSIRADYRDSYAATTGALFDVGWHLVDLALDWFGPAGLTDVRLESAASIGLPDTDGLAELELLHHSGVRSYIHADWLTPGYEQSAVVFGKGGSIAYNWTQRAAYCIARQQMTSQTWSQSGNEQMYTRQMQHFLSAVRGECESCNPIERARQVLDILLEAKRCEPSL